MNKLSNKLATIISYSVGSGITLVTFFVFFFLHEKNILSTGYAIVAGFLAYDLTNVITLAVRDKLKSKEIAFSVYFGAAILCFFGMVLTTSWFLFKLLCALCMALLLIAFTVKNTNPFSKLTFKEKYGETPEEAIKRLEANLRYRLIGDKLKSDLDVNRPLCPNGSNYFTVNQARAAGYSDIADSGSVYIKTIIEEEINKCAKKD